MQRDEINQIPLMSETVLDLDLDQCNDRKPNHQHVLDDGLTSSEQRRATQQQQI